LAGVLKTVVGLAPQGRDPAVNIDEQGGNVDASF